MRNDDYLWDRSGEPDPEVQRLETLLSPLRSRSVAPDLPVTLGASSRRSGLPLALPALAATALVALLAAGAWLMARRIPVTVGWQVARLEGSPRVGAAPMGPTGRLAVGQWIETDAVSRARLHVEGLGEVEVEPGTRLGLVRATPAEHRLSLDRGAIQATITAIPRLFFVDTPSAVAVDLGCAYRLEVDEAGAGELRVLHGWVGLEWPGHESIVPAGGRCATRPGLGPGTPYFDDASESLQAALHSFDTLREGDTGRAAALEIVLREARELDVLTLWHLIQRTEGQQRERVYARMASLAPPPDGVTREGILRADRAMLKSWWDHLGLGTASLYRPWQ